MATDNWYTLNPKHCNFGALHTMAKGREAVDFHQSNCKNPRVRPLNPSHYSQSPKVINDYFLKKATDSRRKFGSDGNGNPNYGWEAVGFFSLEIQSLTRSWPLDSRGYFEQGIKWHAPLVLGLAFGGFTLWLSKSRGRAVGVHGQRFGLWVWPLEASHYTWPKAPLTIFYWLFSAHFFGSTLNKVWPLNPMASRFGRPSVKRPLDASRRLIPSPHMRVLATSERRISTLVATSGSH
jgi:hypothetical protein